jgi:hypothetical protein
LRDVATLDANVMTRATTLTPMLDTIELEAEAWASALLQLNVPEGGSVIVRGPGAGQVGAAWRLLGYGGRSLVANDTPVHPDDDTQAAAADVVALLHAWPEPRTVDVTAQAAARWVRPGGVLMLAELDVVALRNDVPRRTPAALLYQMHPEVAERLAALSPTRIQLVMAGIRAGLDDKLVIDVARPVGVYRDSSERRAAVEFGAWRGLEELDARAYDALLGAVDAVLPPAWPLVESEPWMVVAGRVRP